MSKAGDMRTWLLISHCQTFGLANSLNLLAPGIRVEAIDIWEYRRISRLRTPSFPITSA